MPAYKDKNQGNMNASFTLRTGQGKKKEDERSSRPKRRGAGVNGRSCNQQTADLHMTFEGSCSLRLRT